MKKLIITSSLILLAACSTTQVPLTYTPGPTAHTQGKPLAVVGEVKDSRKYTGTALGAIRGGFGNALKTLQTEKPASEVIRTAIMDGLKSRGMAAAGNPKYVLDIDMIHFDCSQYVRREAHVELNVTLMDKAANKIVYERKVKADKVNGSVITFDAGIFASVEDLRKIANEALQDAVDQLLNDPAFISKFN